jgi:hypothetical protein
MKWFKESIDLLHWSLTYGLALTMVYVFMKAYQNGFEVLVQINNFGEAYVEAGFIILWIVMCIIKSIYYYKEAK